MSATIEKWNELLHFAKIRKASRFFFRIMCTGELRVNVHAMLKSTLATFL